MLLKSLQEGILISDDHIDFKKVAVISPCEQYKHRLPFIVAGTTTVATVVPGVINTALASSQRPQHRSNILNRLARCVWVLALEQPDQQGCR